MKSILRALALLVPLTGSTLAQPAGDPMDACDDWPDLDRTIERLAASLATEQAAPHFWGYISPFYAKNDISGSEEQGFFIGSIRLNTDGDLAGYRWRLSLEGNVDNPDAPPINIKDAYIRVPLFGGVETTWGLFKKPVLASGLIEANRTLFPIRTFNGTLYSVRDWGVQVSQESKGIELTLALQNGADGSGDDMLLTGRVDVNFMGEGRLDSEGAYGAGRKARLNAGYAWSDDRTSDHGRARAFDLALVTKRWSLAGEVMRYDIGYNVSEPGNVFDDLFSGVPTPWTWTATYMLCTHCTEIALRFEDFADKFGRTLTVLGLNHYVEGHDFKWQFNYGKFEEKNEESDYGAVGLTLSF
jgi:hypothetical protein